MGSREINSYYLSYFDYVSPSNIVKVEDLKDYGFDIIQNVDKGSLEKSKKIKLVKDEVGRNRIDPEGKERKLGVLEMELKEFLNSGVFERNKTSKCDRCEYLDICKVGELDEINEK